MDAKYLRDNVNEALIEALASMAVSMPDDSIEYVGKYLIQYVERKALKEKVRLCIVASMVKTAVYIFRLKNDLQIQMQQPESPATLRLRRNLLRLNCRQRGMNMPNNYNHSSVLFLPCPKINKKSWTGPLSF